MIYMLGGDGRIKELSDGWVNPDNIRTCTEQIVAIALADFRFHPSYTTTQNTTFSERCRVPSLGRPFIPDSRGSTGRRAISSARPEFSEGIELRE